MQNNKKYNTYGTAHNCSWYEPCPLCYGCRAYNSKYIRCQKCIEPENGGKKYNICNTELHTNKVLSRMIKHEVIIADMKEVY